MNLAQKASEKEKVTVEEVNSNIEAFENLIKHMKKIDTVKSVCFSNLHMYSDLEYPPKF